MRFPSYSTSQLKEAVRDSRSYAGVLRKLNLKIAGGTQAVLKNHISTNGIDVSHFSFQGWRKSQHFENPEHYSKNSKGLVRLYLLRTRGNKCESCNRLTWLGKPITLEVEHINGNTLDRREENLKLLCPNCHSYTPTWRRRKSALVDQRQSQRV